MVYTSIEIQTRLLVVEESVTDTTMHTEGGRRNAEDCKLTLHK